MGGCVEPSRGTGPLGLQAPGLGILLKEFWMMPKLLIITMGNLLNGYGKTQGMLMVSSEELEQLVLEVDFGPEINCGQFVEHQYSSWFMADLLVQCPKQMTNLSEISSRDYYHSRLIRFM